MFWLDRGAPQQKHVDFLYETYKHAYKQLGTIAKARTSIKNESITEAKSITEAIAIYIDQTELKHDIWSNWNHNIKDHAYDQSGINT